MKLRISKMKWLSLIIVFSITFMSYNAESQDWRSRLNEGLKIINDQTPIKIPSNIPTTATEIILIKNVLKDKDKAALFGGVLLAAYIGNEFLQNLEKEDQKKHQEKTEKALSTGKTQSWNNQKTKTSGKIRVVKTETKIEKKKKLPVLKDRIEQLPTLVIIGKTFSAKKDSNVRGGPGTDFEKVGKLSKKQNVNVVGEVQTKKWYFISYDGIGSGFVSSKLLEPAYSEKPDSSDKELSQDDITTADVETKRVCKTTEHEIKLPDGKTETKAVTFCQGPNGWEAQKS